MAEAIIGGGNRVTHEGGSARREDGAEAVVQTHLMNGGTVRILQRRFC